MLLFQLKKFLLCLENLLLLDHLGFSLCLFHKVIALFLHNGIHQKKCNTCTRQQRNPSDQKVRNHGCLQHQ